MDDNTELERKILQTTTELNNRYQTLFSKLEEARKELNVSHEANQSLENKLSVANTTCGELETVKNKMKHQLQKLEGDLMVTTEQLKRQIIEKEKGLEKAEVCNIE